MSKDKLRSFIRKQIYENIQEQTFIGKTAVTALKRDPKYAYLSSTAKMDAENVLKKGESLTLGEMARPTTQGIVVNKSFKGSIDRLPKLFKDVHKILLDGGNKPKSLVDLMNTLNVNGYSITQQQKIRVPLKNNYLGPTKEFLLKPLGWVDDGTSTVNNRDDADEESDDEQEDSEVTANNKPENKREINRNIVPDSYKLKSWDDYSSEVRKDDEPPMFQPKNLNYKPNFPKISDEDFNKLNKYARYKEALASAKSAYRLLSSKNFSRRSDGLDNIVGEKGTEAERLNKRIGELRSNITDLINGSEYIAKHHQDLIDMTKNRDDKKNNI